MSGFTEIADRVYVLAHPSLRVNCTLIVGDTSALLVDTLSTAAQAQELAQAVAAVSAKPLGLVNTHFHFDHCFGNDTLAGPETPIWGHTHCVHELRDRGQHWQRQWQSEYAALDEQFALEVGRVTVLPPNREVNQRDLIDIGGRLVTIGWHGRGHTAGDLVVQVDDVLIAGDLIEEGAPPGFSDSYPLEWPATVAALLHLATPATVVVPGHGQLVDASFLQAQHDELAALHWLIRDGHGDEAPAEKVVAASPYVRWGEQGVHEATLGVRRGYAQLDAIPLS